MDLEPRDHPLVPRTLNDQGYRAKLDMSYRVCISELCSPSDSWENDINDAKFTVNPATGKFMTYCTFTLDMPDEIILPYEKHPYVFRRTHFWNMFFKRSSRIKTDLISCWSSRGYFVDLAPNRDSGKWEMRVSW